MSNFLAPTEIVITDTLEFGEITQDTINQFDCINGEVAGFQILQVGNNLDGTPYYLSQIYDCSTGTPILQGSTSILPGMDLCGGLFSSGCFPDRDPLDSECIFYTANYPIPDEVVL